MKDSIVFYKSFYEAIKELPSKNQLDIYNAIFQKYFYDEDVSLKGISKGIFNLIIPNVDSANKRYFANVENGKKGGRPKSELKPKENPNITQSKSELKPKHNLNDNDNDNDNVNDNDNITTNIDIFSYIEENFGITISGKNYEDIYSWLQFYTLDILKYAVDISVASGKRTIRYWEGILNNWKGCNYKSLIDIKENEDKKNKKVKSEPEWLNKNIKPELASEEEQKEIEEYLKNL